MNFSSISAYLDPANWQQQMSHQVGGSSSGVSSQLLPPPSHPPPPPPPPPPPASHGVGGTGLIRPGSMAERARMANMPMPETALKCPRCESTNTKFCYFNNYSLTQPRHFCKTCRRYWTRGGALRSVPVGGGCRRNKRSKGSSSKSPVSSDRQTSGGSAGNSSTSTMPSNSGHSSDMIGLSPHIPPLRFMAPLHQQLSHDYEIGGMNYALSYGALSAPMSGVGNDLNFQVGNANLGGGNGGGVGGSTIGSLLGLDPWRLQQAPQFPFLSGLDSSSAMFDNATGGEATGYMGQARQKPSTSRNITQLGNSMKMEDNQELNVGRQFLSGSIQGNHEQYWSSSANAWSDLSGFSSSSSTRNPL